MTRLIFSTFIALTLAAFVHPARLSAQQVAVTINGEEDGGRITRHLYGHFAEHLGRCIYDGIWVGPDSDIPNTNGLRNDVLEALREVQAPNLRWPGGCFADDYHWQDGIGDPERRPKTVNIHWGQVIDDNSFGTHEFLALCEELDAAPYIAGNVGSGTPEELRDWIEYMTFDGDSDLANLRRANGREEPWDVRFFGIGNENWGCGGNMTAQYYADLYKRFATFARDLSGNRLVRVACGPGGRNPDWTQVMADDVGRQMQGLSMHFYTQPAPWNDKLPATGFGEDEWFRILETCLEMDDAIRENAEILADMRRGRRGRGGRNAVMLYVDEWGTWYRTEEGHPGYSLFQQNTIRDALVAGMTFHIFHEHLDSVAMANIAQTVNVLQALVLTEGDKMIKTPTFHVFEMYKVHHDATRLPVKFESPPYEFEGDSMPAVSVSASRAEDGKVHVSLTNAHPRDAFTLACDMPGVSASSVTGRILTAEEMDAHNTFDDPDNLVPTSFDGASLDGGKLNVELPPKSVVVLELAE